MYLGNREMHYVIFSNASRYWDDWVREPGQMGQGAKSCIRPEISRTSTFGKKGVSNGQFFNEHLKFINHATTDVHFTQLDLSYLFKVVPVVDDVLINSRTALAGAIIGLLLFLSQFKEFELYWGAVFF